MIFRFGLAERQNQRIFGRRDRTAFVTPGFQLLELHLYFSDISCSRCAVFVLGEAMPNLKQRTVCGHNATKRGGEQSFRVSRMPYSLQGCCV